MVTDIIIYPVKSLGGSKKTAWFATKSGFKHDRNWMLIDKEDKKLTQREFPLLSIFSCDIVNDIVEVNYQGQKISWATDQSIDPIIKTKVWDDDVFVKEVNPGVNQFFSDCLQQEVRLVKQEKKLPRHHFVQKWNEDIQVSLADGYPYLVVGSRSVENLNTLLHTPVTYRNFRPNIVVSSHIAHEEDQWDDLLIGNAILKNVKPCARCQVVNVNPFDGTINKNVLARLSKYRKDKNNIYFGTNMTCISEGMIAVGNVIKHMES